jgi:hypothetical protein
LINIFPQTIHSDEAEYKIGIITTYVLSDLNMGRNYFTELSQKENITPQVISGIYQLGLLAQWEGNLEEARRYYLTLKEKAKEGFPETIGLANERLRELEESRPIEYKLKTFLDISLRPQNNAYFDRTRIDLRSHPYRSAKDEDTDINTSLYYGENGCMQPEIEYLWSGHLGTYRPSSKESQSAEAWALTKPDTNQYSFSTKYIHQGTKEINLVVVSSGGIIDRNLDMVDVY